MPITFLLYKHGHFHSYISLPTGQHVNNKNRDTRQHWDVSKTEPWWWLMCQNNIHSPVSYLITNHLMFNYHWFWYGFDFVFTPQQILQPFNGSLIQKIMGQSSDIFKRGVLENATDGSLLGKSMRFQAIFDPTKERVTWTLWAACYLLMQTWIARIVAGLNSFFFSLFNLGLSENGYTPKWLY